MKRDEAIAHVRSIGRNCRGKRRATITPRDYQRMSPALQDALAVVAPSVEDAPSRTPDELISALFEAGSRQEASELDQLLRVGCGWDASDFLAAGPFDGTAGTVECPKCGLPIGYTRAVIDIDDAEPTS